MNTISVDLTSDSYQIHVDITCLRRPATLIHSCTPQVQKILPSHSSRFEQTLWLWASYTRWSQLAALLPLPQCLQVSTQNRLSRIKRKHEIFFCCLHEKTLWLAQRWVIGDLTGFVAATYARMLVRIHLFCDDRLFSDLVQTADDLSFCKKSLMGLRIT